MKLSRFLCCAVFVFFAVLYCIFIVPICNHTVYGVWCFIAWILAGVLLFMVFEVIITIPEKYLNKYFADAWDVVGWVVALMICVSYEGYYDSLRIENGPTIITKYHITKIKSIKGSRYAIFGYFNIGSRKYKDDFKYSLKSYKPKGKWSYIMYLLDCEQPLRYYAIDPTGKDIAKIHDFAFMEGGTLYSYHDYALKHPDLVHSTVGFNLIYKARCRWYNAADSVVSLYFIDQNYNEEMLWYRLGRNEVFSDTMLIYRNLLDDNSYKPTLYVCLPELNTPENRAKINRYGYIFHHDICSKEDIETQCPRIKEYVDSKLATSFEVRFYNDEPVFALPQKKD